MKGTFHISGRVFEVKENVFIDENFHFHLNIFSDFPRWRTYKHQERKFLHYLGVFEVHKNVIIDEKNYFFAPTYYPIFQDGGPKNTKKGTFYITWGFSRLIRTLLLMKIIIFSPQHIIRFSKMADLKKR